ncbi:AI-2E family transporter [Bacteroidota bacterium]
MKEFIKYFLIFLGLVILGWALVFFKSIVAYILIAFLISLIGRPLVDILGKIRIRKFCLPRAIRAVLALAFIWFIIITFFRIFIPIIANEANELSKINTDSVLKSLEPIKKVEAIYDKMDLGGEEKLSFEDYVTKKISSVFSITWVTNLVEKLAGTLVDLFIAIFSISFISFFFLKESNLFEDGVLLLVPSGKEKKVHNTLLSIKHLLKRYFIGIGGQITGIFILLTIGLTICGVGFHRALVIALFAGIMNVIPYVGPLIGAFFGIMIGIVSHLDMDFYTEILPLISYMALTFMIVQLIDNLLFQPLIFSKSVNAHPLEIFLVIMIAGSFAGIPGMIVAIPAYTVLRVIAKEFFNQFKVVKKLTEKI